MVLHMEYFIMLSLFLIVTMTESYSVPSGLIESIVESIHRLEERLKNIEAPKQVSSCPNGWLYNNNTCYLFAADVKRTFIEAKAYCGHLDSHMVQLETEEENAFIKEHLQTLKENHYWIGLSDIYEEGIWRWNLLGDIPSFTDWAPGWPNSNGDQDCGLLHIPQEYRWIDYFCTHQSATVCEKDLN